MILQCLVGQGADVCAQISSRIHGGVTAGLDVFNAKHHGFKKLVMTPRLWKQHFAANPLRSDLYNISN